MTAADDRPDSDQSACRQQRLTRFLAASLGLLILVAGGCAQREHRQDVPAPSAPAEAAATAPLTIPEDSAPLYGDIDAETVVWPLGEIREGFAQPPETDIWLRLRDGFVLGHIDHPRIAREIRRLKRSPNAFRALMARSEPYLRYILDQVEDAGLPSELALLPAVESGFRPHVYSAEGAAGLWQFMPATGRTLGLGQDWWFDKRRALRTATPAAMRHLRRLNKRFSGDWLHALAAYNAGVGKVSRSIRHARRRGEPTDFWSLDLPGETDIYVPRLLALAAVTADPESFGLDLPEIIDRPYFAVAATDGQIDLTVAAQLAQLPVEELMALNAGNKRWASHPDGPHELLLPIDRVERFEQALAVLPDDQRLRWQRHRIQRGDSLSRLADRYGVTVEVIRRANGLRDSRIRAGKDLLIPMSGSVTVADLQASSRARQRLRYRVRKGDSLYKIAQRFQVSIADLRRWNRIGRYIHPGEKLTLFIDPDA